MATKVQEAAKPAEVRAWARENGHTVGVRGRIKADIVEAFKAETKRSVVTAG